MFVLLQTFEFHTQFKCKQEAEISLLVYVWNEMTQAVNVQQREVFLCSEPVEI